MSSGHSFFLHPLVFFCFRNLCIFGFLCLFFYPGQNFDLGKLIILDLIIPETNLFVNILSFLFWVFDFNEF